MGNRNTNNQQTVLFDVNANKNSKKLLDNLSTSQLYEKYKSVINSTTLFKRSNVSFQANKKLPFYRWFSYKEGFSFDMVSKILSSLNIESGYVFDPFAGSGTTLFAARDSGFRSFGIEIMPIGMEIYHARGAIEKIDKNVLRKYIEKLKEINFEKAPIDKNFNFTHLRITRGAFPEDNERCLNAFRTYLNTEIRDPEIKTIFNFIGMCLLEKISYTSKDGQFLRWDKTAGKGRSNYIKSDIFTFDAALNRLLKEIMNDLSGLNMYSQQKKPEAKLQNSNTFETLPKMPNDMFDVIISSPPYCNRYDYTSTYALELAYLGIDEVALKNLRQNMLSSTVESKGRVKELEFMYSKKYGTHELSKIENAFYSNTLLSEILKKLEFYKNNKQLNNPGIYRMVFNYFYEHAFIIYEMQRILKKGGHIYYVNDNVRYAGEEIPVDLILSEFAENLGLKTSDIFVLSEKKGNSSQQMARHGKVDLRKCVYHWVKI